ncbi:MAG: SMP-30/gluconolactonase/LRE family protein [Planctomycetes bacterium]|nr:SMP-30/gluconolactonase/LRE family protein [Planctomycetota bacterium]
MGAVILTVGDASLEAGLQNLLEPNARFEKLADGFGFTEGPAWHPRDGYLVFSDILGDCQYRWTPQQGVQELRRPSNMANGSAWGPDGSLWICEHATSRLARLHPDWKYEVAADRFRGAELNSPNDVVVNGAGHVFFTDPNSGRSARWGVARSQDLDFQGVFRFEPDTGRLVVLADDFSKPNGLCFSPDRKRLFVNDTDRQHIRWFDLAADGRLHGGAVWAETGGPGPGVADGMKFDALGNLWCCGAGGIHVFDAAGRRLGIVPAPEVAANLAWGGADGRDLFVTASTSLYRLRTRVAGQVPCHVTPAPFIPESHDVDG